ncbi:MAG: hypothetical protein WKF82_03480 [Nocardioidaceae bacterium]
MTRTPERGAHAVESFVESVTTAFKNAQSSFRGGGAEEGKADFEVVVVPGARSCRRDKLCEPVFADRA